jgi:hypothetical protein
VHYDIGEIRPHRLDRMLEFATKNIISATIGPIAMGNNLFTIWV